jgi:hypothetical protein
VTGRHALAWLTLLAAPVLAPPACAETGVVGGECAAGRLACEGRCVDPSTDPRHCGACDRICASDESCVAGTCRSGDAAAGASGTAGAGGAAGAAGIAGIGGIAGAAGAAGVAGAAGSSGAAGTAGSGGADPGDGAADAADACVPPFNSADRCGDCSTACAPPAALCAPVDGGYGCVAQCAPPLAACGDVCADVDSDPRHCGGCFAACPSGLCQAGTCVGATVGHVVAICSDHEWSFENAPQTTLLGNAVFLPARNPVRALAFTGFVDPATRASADQTIAWAAAQKGRALVTADATTGAEVQSRLNVIDFDLLLVYDQPNAPAGTLAALGASLAASIDAFTRAGGTAVVLAGTDGAGEMGAFLSDAGLLPVSGQNPADFAQLHNRAPADAVGLNVLTPFLALPTTCTFATSVAPDAETVFVVTDAAPDAGTGAPAVVHRIQLP